jgi:hypothetical protein
MSTILEALRRLEEDRPATSDKSADSAGREQADAPGSLSETLLATDPRATDQLRERILAEEAAPRSIPSDEGSKGMFAAVLERRGLAIVSALVLLGAVGIAGFALTDGASRGDSEGASNRIAEASTPPSAALEKSPGALASASPTALSRDRAGIPVSAPTESAPQPTEERSLPVPAIVPLVATDSGNDSSPLAAPTPTPTSASPPTALAPPAPRAKSDAKPVPLAAVVPTRSAAEADPLLAGASRSASRAELADPGMVAVHTSANPSPPESLSKRPSPTSVESAPAVVSAPVPTSPALTASTRPSSSRSASTSTTTTRTDSNPSSRGTNSAKPKKAEPDSRVAGNDVRPAPPPAATAEKPILAARPTEATSKPSSASPPREVAEVERSNLPDVSVVQTSWHPRAGNRSAKVRLESGGENLLLREGDAVGGLIVQEITPSSVLFTTGEIEIRRRVGQSGSSR